MPRVTRALLLLALLAVPAAAEGVPLPRPRPVMPGSVRADIPLPLPRPALPDFLLQSALITHVPPGGAAATAEPPAPPEPSACQLRLGAIATITPQPPLIGPGECGAVDVVRLEGVVLADKTRIVMNPPATLRCEMAEAVAQWMREDVAAVASSLGAPLVGVENFDSYDCRGRNRIVGAKLSEHGKANAIDIRAIKLADGRLVQWTDPAVEREARENLRKGACARFMTVLGPGSDGYHESHIHVDLAERRGNYRMCQWDVRDLADLVPLPRPRPAEAPVPSAQVEEEPE